MPKAGKKVKPQKTPEKLQGWATIAAYLGVSRATAEHWAKTGMPVRREGRFTVANPNDLRSWLGKEVHMPAPPEVMAPVAYILSLKESIAAARRQKRRH